mmetsp:Transcript_11321/g.28903  ORF Transcript_11321/g.28903 Transcript_11321/m.28903 type:complete len:82 (-) Transcript_11321:87-332(-)
MATKSGVITAGPRDLPEGQYCVDCDEGRDLSGREALAQCLKDNGNNMTRCQTELKAFQAAARAAREGKQTATASPSADAFK